MITSKTKKGKELRNLKLRISEVEVVSKEVKTDTTTVLTCMVKGVTKPFTFAWVDAVSFFCISILGCVAYRNADRDLVLNASFELFEGY